MVFSSVWGGNFESMVLQAEPEDFNRIADLHAQSFVRGWTVEEISDLHNDPAVAILVARRVGRKPGHLDGFNIVRQAADEGEILSVVVDAGLRGAGLGARLMREAITRFQTDRLANVFLEVAKDNHPAVSLYKRLGFETVGERKGYYEPAGGSASAEHTREPGDAPDPERGTALVMRLGLV
ncbi:MAG: N-acetyltransferase [Pseudomonadota bacterium]